MQGEGLIKKEIEKILNTYCKNNNTSEILEKNTKKNND